MLLELWKNGEGKLVEPIKNLQRRMWRKNSKNILCYPAASFYPFYFGFSGQRSYGLCFKVQIELQFWI